jgi:hypothetical protein
MIITFQLMFGDQPGSSCRRSASTGGNGDTELPGSVLPLLRKKTEKVTGIHECQPTDRTPKLRKVVQSGSMQLNPLGTIRSGFCWA